MNLFIKNHILLYLLILSIFDQPIGGEYVTVKSSDSMEAVTANSNLKTYADPLRQGTQASKNKQQHSDRDIGMEYDNNDTVSGKGTDNIMDEECENVSEVLDTTHSKDCGEDGGACGRKRLCRRTMNSINTTPALNNNKSASKVSNLFIRVKTITFTMAALIGIVANIFSLMIIIKQGLIKSGVWVYIAALSVSDILTIITFYIYEFSKDPANYFGFLYTNNNFTCKLMVSLQYCFGTMSVYFLVFMTVERAVLILSPYRQPTSQKQAMLVVIIIIILWSVSYLTWIFISYGILEFPASVFGRDGTEMIQACTLLPKFHKYLSLYTWLEFTIYYVIPVFLIISANICIIYVLTKRAKSKGINRSKIQAKKDEKITRMLIVLSVSFVITISPSALYATILWKYFYESTEVAFAFDNVAYNISITFSTLLFCGNFFIYCLSGEMFRQEAIKFLRNICCCKCAENQTTVTTESRPSMVHQENKI